MGDPQHRLLLRGAGDLGGAPGGDVREEGLTPAGAGPRRPGLDVFVVPALLLLVARDLRVLDPPRVLAWRLLHDPRLEALPGWLAAILPRPLPEIDRDPIALLLSTAAVLFALLYLAAGVARRGTRFRAGVVIAAAAALVVAPTVAFMAMGWALDRPYGQDGGVVQLPLALDKILDGQSPYAADYSQSVLAKEARTSRFWAARGGNPILRHHAYLPGTHWLAMPFHLASRAAGVTFDPRVLTLLAYALAAWLASRLVTDPAARLSAAACVLVNPLVYWHQVFGANDIVFVAMVLGAALLVKDGRAGLAAAVLGLACATKQLAWPFAPFLLLVASGTRWPLAGDWRAPAARLVRLSGIALGVFTVVVLPVAALDFRAFYADIVGYNVGLPGADNYPLGGTPGFGFANLLIYFGAVASLGDYFPFGIFYLLLVPLGLLLARATLRRGGAGAALVAGSAALLASLYFSRVVHPNYAAPLAVLLPVGAMAAALAADVAVVPLLLAAVAVEIAELSPLRLLWEDALAVRLPAHVSGVAALLRPRAGAELTDDPLSLAWSATAAGLAVAYLAAGAAGAGAKVRALVVAAAVVLVTVLPSYVVLSTGARTGVHRAQDEWVADAVAWRPGPGTVREAWSPSFREEPPRLLSADARPGRSLLGRVTRGDPRLVSIAAVLLAAALLLARGEIARAPLRATWLLAPPAVTTVAFGGPHVIGLALLLAALAIGRARPRVGAVLAVSTVPVWLFLIGRWPEVGAGYGFVNAWTYFGRAPGPVALALFAVTAIAAAVWLVRRAAGDGVATAAAGAVLAALLAAPSSSPDAALVPLSLLLLGAVSDA